MKDGGQKSEILPFATFHVISRLFISQSDCADVQAQKEQTEQNK